MTDEINVLSRTQIINVDPVTNSVSIIMAGPPGPPGPGGGGGDSLWTYDGVNTMGLDPTATEGLVELDIFPISLAGGVAGITIVDLEGVPTIGYVDIVGQGHIYLYGSNDIQLNSDGQLGLYADGTVTLGGAISHVNADSGYLSLDSGDANRFVGQGNDVHVESSSGDNIYIQTSGGSGQVRVSSGSHVELSSGGDLLIDANDDVTLHTDGGNILLETTTGNVQIFGTHASHIHSFVGDDHTAEFIFTANDADEVSRDGFVSMNYGFMSMQGINGVGIYTNGGATHGVFLGVGGDESSSFTSPVIFDVVPAAPSDSMLGRGQAVFWRSGDSLRVKAKNSSGVVKSLTLGTLT